MEETPAGDPFNSRNAPAPHCFTPSRKKTSHTLLVTKMKYSALYLNIVNLNIDYINNLNIVIFKYS